MMANIENFLFGDLEPSEFVFASRIDFSIGRSYSDDTTVRAGLRYNTANTFEYI